MGLSGDTMTPSRRIWKNVEWTHLLSAAIHWTTQHEDLCVMKQSPSSKTKEARFWSRNVQSVSKRHNRWATLAPGHVITVQGSALPESECTLTISLIDDKDNRSIDFDGAVHVCVCVCIYSPTMKIWTHTHNTTVLRLCGICPGKPGWAGTRRTFTHYSHRSHQSSLSAFSI